MGFYQDITTRYGINTTNWLKRWSNLNTKKASFVNRRIYLLECRRNGINPRHITQNQKSLFNLMEGASVSFIRRLDEFNKRVGNKILNFEISHTNYVLKEIDKEMLDLYKNIVKVLPRMTYENYFSKQKIAFSKKFHKTKEENLVKIGKLISENRANWKIADKWFRNISSKQIPENVKLVLALGPKFNLHTTVKDINVERLLAHVEQLVGKVCENRRNIIRAKVTSVVTNYMHRYRDQKIGETKLINDVKRFLRENEDLLVLKSDKGGVTVIMDKDRYDMSMKELLDNTVNFKKLNRNPTLTVQNKANGIISNLVKLKCISDETGKTLKIYNAVTPRIYGNPKIHKEGFPLRPIVAGIQGPANKVAKYTALILKKAYNIENDYYIGDSFQFARKINNMKIPENYVVISLDVVNLFGSISKSIIIKAITKNWETIKEHTNGLTKKGFIEMIEFILDNNYFSYKNEYYLQIFGCAMGSKLSPILAQYVMDYILDECLPKVPYQPAFLKKFVDDIILAVPNDGVESILDILNNFDPHIKFTVEKEENRSVPFLDTLVIRDIDNTIKLDWYRKPNAAGRYVHYRSNHSMSIKINFIKQMKNRINTICHEKFKYKNLKILENLLTDNDYPRGMVRKLLYNKVVEIKKPPDRQNNETNFGVLPYYDNLTDRLIKIFHEEQIKVAKKSIKSVGSLFSNLKDRIPKMMQSNVVYKLTCDTCSKVYVGQTSQWLKSRLALHKSDIKKGVDRCALAGHVKENKNHVINFDNAVILEKEVNYERRVFLEMTSINTFPNSINKKSDVQNLNVIYTYLLQYSINNFYDGPLDE